MDHDVVVAVVLHDFEDLYLMCFEASAVAVNEVTEEVKQLTFVVAVIRLFFNVLTDLLDQLKHYHLVVKHCFVVIVHLFQEVDASYILTDMVNHLRNMPLHYCLYLVEIFNQSHDEIVTHVQQFDSQLTLRHLFACENEVQHFSMQI